MDTQKQVIDRLKQANNVLVTVSNDPSVDQLAACIGLSLALNKLGKHATAVFSGNVPSTIEFLQPEETIEKNTDSLRDFIISLDKSKADKLRYKVEDKLVRIFITPYRTSISDNDLEFSQGDFNVDVVLAIGVQDQKELDQAVTAHGRILHDATVVTVNNQEQGGELGSIHWIDTAASSLSEMAAVLGLALSKDVFDQQIATALLTGIVAETGRFSNEKTSADTMSISASLIAAGANQQLVANKLQESPQVKDTSGDTSEAPEASARVNDDGTLEINHDADDEHDEPQPSGEERQAEQLSPEKDSQPEKAKKLGESEEPKISSAKQTGILEEQTPHYKNPRTAVSPPPFSSDTDPNLAGAQEPFVDPLTLPPVDATEPILHHDVPSPAASQRDHSHDTLTDIEQEVNSPHLHANDNESPRPSVITPSDQPAPDTPKNNPEELNLEDLQRPEGIDEPASAGSVDAARDAVEAAMADTQTPLDPITALNAKPLGEPLHAPSVPQAPQQPIVNNQLVPPQPPNPPLSPTADQPMTMPLPGTPVPPPTQDDQQTDQSNAAPSAPPPIIPPFPPQ